MSGSFLRTFRAAVFLALSSLAACAPARQAVEPASDAAVVELVSRTILKEQMYMGQWAKAKDGLVVQRDNGARLCLPHKLASNEYDVTMDFTREAGNQGFGLFLTAGGKSFLFQLSAVDNRWVSLSDFEGDDPANKSRVAWALPTDGKRHRLQLMVRRTGINAFVDDQPVFDFKTDYSNVIQRDWGFGNCSIGLISWYNVVRFHAIEVKEVGGK